jgi:ABC-type nitrate/sulfonate/bicarbonate transport system substrate-binding protein
MSHSLNTLWYTRSPHPSPLGLASQLGWFHEEFFGDGVNVFTVSETDTQAAASAQPDRHLTHSIRQGGNVPAIWARSRGHATRVIGLNWLEEYQGIISLRGSGIATPKDLQGRRAGLPLFSSPIEGRRAEALHGFLVALEVGGLAASDVEFVDVSHQPRSPARGSGADLGPFAEYAALIRALRAGEVDAVFVKGARGLQATHDAAAQLVLDVSAHPDPLVRVHTGGPRPITVHQDLLDRHPEVVVRFLSRVVAIGPWAASHPAETLAYMSRETRTEASWVRDAYGADLHLFQRTDLHDIAVQALEVHKAFLLKWGFIPNDFEIRDWIDPAPLAEVLRRHRDLASSPA